MGASAVYLIIPPWPPSLRLPIYPISPSRPLYFYTSPLAIFQEVMSSFTDPSTLHSFVAHSYRWASKPRGRALPRYTLLW